MHYFNLCKTKSEHIQIDRVLANYVKMCKTFLCGFYSVFVVYFSLFFHFYCFACVFVFLFVSAFLCAASS